MYYLSSPGEAGTNNQFQQSRSKRYNDKNIIVIILTIETAFLILCECPTFSSPGKKISEKQFKTNSSLPNQKVIKNTLKKIVHFFNITEVVEGPNKYEKLQLSPR